ncbi:leucine_Rich Repeat (LRR)-containing protein [Hexamita inflata]|uniref:Partial n=1 Tax=Hexamita inflata TaxID=28002 RepID=A0AA86QTA9_9EUKA|nr:leucine Rich Repeat (LRR)-containing protein [Hexamita inflata]
MSQLAIRNYNDLQNHFNMSQKLEVIDLQQMQNLLLMNISSEVWVDAEQRNLLFFNREFIEQTQEFIFQERQIMNHHLLSFLSNLTLLNLSRNEISEISSFSKLKNLQTLDLSANKIENISTLKQLTNLTELNIQRNKITSYNVELPNLKSLKIGQNRLEDCSGLQYSPKLQYLNLFGTDITDINKFIPQQLFNLKSLQLEYNNISELMYVSNFVNLQSLSLTGNQNIKNIDPLKQCTQLTELKMMQTNVSDIWPLQFMKNLTFLDLQQTLVIDLHPLQYLYKLEHLHVTYANVIDVSPLSHLSQLQDLCLIYNKIVNWEPIKHHKNYPKLINKDEKTTFNLYDQKHPTTDEYKFYNLILKVHSSHKQIRKLLFQNQKFRYSLSQKKNNASVLLTNQKQMLNKTISILVPFISYNNTYFQ